MTQFAPKTILVPVALDPDDDPAFAGESIKAATSLAKQFSSRVILLNLASAVSPGMSAPIDMSGKIYQVASTVLQARLTRGREELAHLEDDVKKAGVAVESHVLEALDSPANAICDAARQFNADLIVIGSHGRKGLKRVLLGSTAERVVHLASCPVLLLRPNEEVK